MFKLKIKTFLRKNYPNLYEIITIIYSRIILKKKNNIKFSGWGLTTTQSPPWIGISKNKTYIGFKNAIVVYPHTTIEEEKLVNSLNNFKIMFLNLD